MRAFAARLGPKGNETAAPIFEAVAENLRERETRTQVVGIVGIINDNLVALEGRERTPKHSHIVVGVKEVGERQVARVEVIGDSGEKGRKH